MGVLQQVEEAKSRIDNLSVDEVRSELASGDVLLVDVRDVRERWRDGTIPGARHVPRGMLEFCADPESPYYKPFMQREKRVIAFCAGGMRSALAASALKELGYENVGHLEAGFDGWKKSGAHVEDVPRKE
jgi:rhodanese-related sulfurtransferase